MSNREFEQNTNSALVIFIPIFVLVACAAIIERCCCNQGRGFNGMMNRQQNLVGFGVPPPLQYQQPQLVQAIQSNPSAQVGQQGLQGHTSVLIDSNQVVQSQSPSVHPIVPTGWGATSAAI